MPPAPSWTRPGAEAAALLAILVAGGLLFAHGLNVPPSYDEGAYLAQTDALLHGQRLGTDVFAAQPPGFDWLLVGVGKIDGLGVDQLRLASLALALLGLLAVAAVARAVAGPAAGVAAAAVLVVAPSYPTFAAQVSADLPGCVLAMLALACMLTPSKHRRVRLVAAGLLFAAAESVKLDAFVLLLPVPLYCWAGRLRLADIGVAAAAAGAALLAGVAVVGGALPDVWRDAVGVPPRRPKRERSRLGQRPRADRVLPPSAAVHLDHRVPRSRSRSSCAHGRGCRSGRSGRRRQRRRDSCSGTGRCTTTTWCCSRSRWRRRSAQSSPPD